MKKILSAMAVWLLFSLCAGCSFKGPEEMYTLPKPPAEYNNLNTCIQQTMEQLGAEYAAPLAGDNAQTVQLVDLDGDGVEEAVACFRVPGDPKPLKVQIFKLGSDESYHSYAVIEGEGTAVYSIDYENLGDSGELDVVVSWRMSDRVHTLAAYCTRNGTVSEWMRTGYAGYRVLDIDMDNQKEILVLQMDATEATGRVELYDYQENAMVFRATAPMSSGINAITAIRTGFLRDSVPALFVASSFGESNGVLTDIFAWKGETLQNITMNTQAGRSLSTVRHYNLVSGTDINSDSVLEIPMPEALPTYQKPTTGLAADFWTVDWRQYDIDGNAWSVGATYHNVQDRWYLILPGEWDGKLSLMRRDNTVYNERGLVFSYWRGEDLDPVPFLIIYRLTGENRESRGRIGGRFVLATQSDAVYAAEFLDNGWDCGLDQETLRQRFCLIQTTWSDEG